jgi:arylsulfatase A-like enzyme
MGSGALDEHQSPPDPDDTGLINRAQYARNFDDFEGADDFFASKVFAKTTQWVHDSREWDQWFCYVDSFDVHQPFHCSEPYASMYTDEDPRDPNLVTWPYYGGSTRARANSPTGNWSSSGRSSLARSRWSTAGSVASSRRLTRPACGTTRWS